MAESAPRGPSRESGDCALCGSSSTTVWLRRGEWQYRHCKACSAVWLDPLPGESWAADFYDRPYFEGGGRGGYRDYLAEERQHTLNARSRVALAKRFGAAPPGLWLDVGCAAGYTLAEARNAGFEVRGVDVSPWARAVARERFQLELYSSLTEARRVHEGQASVLTMFQVLEHLADPLAALELAHACLRPGGLLLIETWDRASLAARLFGKHWQQITPPSVAWLFDRPSLTYALARARFALKEMLPTSKAVSLGWVCGQLAEKAPVFLSSTLSRVAGGPLGRLEAKYRLGDLVTLVASADATPGTTDALSATALDAVCP